MKKLLIIFIAVLLFALVHEGLHALVAVAYGEFDAFHIRPFGLEVTVRTPTEQRQGFMWAIFSGLPNLVTSLIGYLLFAGRRGLASLSNSFLRSLAYFATLIFMLFDPLNLSIIPFLFGGDINGIVVGTGLPRLLIQAAALLVLLFNRELLARYVLPAFGVATEHPVFKPWLSRARAA